MNVVRSMRHNFSTDFWYWQIGITNLTLYENNFKVKITEEFGRFLRKWFLFWISIFFNNPNFHSKISDTPNSAIHPIPSYWGEYPSLQIHFVFSVSFTLSDKDKKSLWLLLMAPCIRAFSVIIMYCHVFLWKMKKNVFLRKCL